MKTYFTIEAYLYTYIFKVLCSKTIDVQAEQFICMLTWFTGVWLSNTISFAECDFWALYV